MRALRFGDVSVERCVEAEGPSFFPAYIFPSFQPDAFDAERGWLDPWAYDAASGRLRMSLHSYVVRTPRHTVLVDTCVGNDKPRPETPAWHMQQKNFLGDLARLGVHPDEVDYVLCTHLHVDHVGWNTRLFNGRWVPTFPNAKYLFHRDEYEHWSRHEMTEARAGTTRRESFEDSVLPVVDANQAMLVDGDFEIDDSLRLEPSPGHSPGHVYLALASKSESALFTGDVLHHPVQIAYPEWNSRYCFDTKMSRATREALVARCCDSSTTLFAAHFPEPVAGRIVSNGVRCRFDPEPG